MPKSWNSVAETSVSRSGGRMLFPSLEDAVACNYWRIQEAIAWFETSNAVRGHNQKTIHMGNFLPVSNTRFYHGWDGGRVMFLDELHMAIPMWKIVEAYRSLAAPAPFFLRNKQPGVFRIDPVPRTGAARKRCWHGRTGKAYATYQERRAVDALNGDEDAVDYKILVRGKRSLAALPDAYDDLPSGRRSKNWKRFRRTRWKPVTGDQV